MNGAEQSSRCRAAKSKPAPQGSCRSLPQAGSSPLPAFAKDHEPVSRDVCQVELHQFRPPQAGAKKNRKNGKITATAVGLIVPGSREQPVEAAGVDRPAWAESVTADMGEVADSAEGFVGDVSQTPGLSQDAP